MSEREAARDPELERRLAEVAVRGYTILERVIEPELLAELADSLARLEREHDVRPADNDFEGRRTVRIYNLLAWGGPFARVPIHPAVLPVVEGVLDPGCLVSSLSSIAIGPGESAQPLHADDQLIGLPRPHPTLVCNTMWALSDFTEANGATRVVPDSHRDASYPEYGRAYASVAAEMEKGSVLVWNGGLWHAGGANRTSQPRVGIAMNYCAGFLRQQENQQLGVPREVARGYPERLQRLLGYGVYRHLIGHIVKRDPITLLGEERDLRTVWERVPANPAGS
jgi:ectoine hydroxylase-related dioxygenase (phytanoyl-CoA dioxygenase family)